MSKPHHLEVLHRAPAPGAARNAPPLLFVHGAYVGAWCWEDTFLPYFSGLGYDCHALSLVGHAGSAGRERLDLCSLGDYQRDIADVAAQLAAPPVLIGHSLGGYLAQRHARKHPVAGLALLASVPPYGLAGSLTYMGLSAPHLLGGLNRFQWHLGPDGLDYALLRELLFSDSMTRERLNAFAARAQPESTLALTELLMPQPWLLMGMPHDVPCMVLGAEHDRIIPRIDVMATARAWHVEPEFVAIGHALMVDSGWEGVAARLANWLGVSFGGAR
ncbi:alpha/beta hydrolase [Chitiniphilus eburneus]|uniref:Alpha/beta hydrolase n=1 Tax=Chitiniphilus eburneus TaxID=2571148 RepID=A0A4V5MPE8_9NEIS|nr:alpha/beta hydrolase [Chitiniphilus eburneus]TJZ68388.1 alpha/beta hydrolase [Chitiniphilus eburneus]